MISTYYHDRTLCPCCTVVSTPQDPRNGVRESVSLLTQLTLRCCYPDMGRHSAVIAAVCARVGVLARSARVCLLCLLRSRPQPSLLASSHLFSQHLSCQLFVAPTDWFLRGLITLSTSSTFWHFHSVLYDLQASLFHKFTHLNVTINSIHYGPFKKGLFKL